MKVLVTGGCGLIGYHTTKYYLDRSEEVFVMDNLERSKLLGHNVSRARAYHNSDLLEEAGAIMLRRDVSLESSFADLPQFDLIVHLAAQCGVPTSIADPKRDFDVNAVGTHNVMETARRDNATVVYASTNKVYPLHSGWFLDEDAGRWRWENDEWDKFGFPLDGHLTSPVEIKLGARTPYGTSKYTGDLYCQEYAETFGVRTGVFRMSCIYGTHQFGFEEQGWATWFAIAALKGNARLNIYGDGNQVRDMLWVEDLVKAYDAFANGPLDSAVFNMGGGPNNTLTLHECVNELVDITREPVTLQYEDWRPSDQRVYTTDIRPAMEALNWEPTVTPQEGLKKVCDWAKPIIEIF